MNAPHARSSYEGTGGWKDGRLGQAYDLIAEVLDERGELRFNNPLLSQVEQLDEDHSS
jgi:hypothetical protein